MDRIRRFLWKNLGITLDRQTYLIIAAVLISLTVLFIFGFVPAVTHNRLLSILLFVLALPGLAVIFGGIYLPLSWGLSNKQERRNIETEVGLKQLRKHVRFLSRKGQEQDTL